MAKSSRGRGKGSSGTKHKKKHSSSTGKASLKESARRTTRTNCVRRPGRLARQRIASK